MQAVTRGRKRVDKPVSGPARGCREPTRCAALLKMSEGTPVTGSTNRAAHELILILTNNNVQCQIDIHVPRDTSDTHDINLYHITMVHAKRHPVIAIAIAELSFPELLPCLHV